jgi:putative ABC transport system permease protein
MSFKRFWKRHQRDDDFAREIEAYLEHEIDRNLERGLSPHEARAAAIRKFGNITSYKEKVHDMNTVQLLDSFLQDMRHGIRWLALNPAFSLVAVISLALGIGANTAIFQLIDAVRIRTLPVPEASQLAEVRLAPPRARSGNFTGRRPELTFPIWQQLQARQQAFSGLFAWGTAAFDLSSGGEARTADGLWVSGSFFDVLRVPAFRGRLLQASDDVPGCAAPGAVISYGFWEREFGGRESAIGSQVSVDGRPFEILGIAPAAFFGMEVGRSFDVALPLCARGLWRGQELFTSRWDWWLAAAGRLKGGVSREQASADLRGISTGIFEETVDSRYNSSTADSYRRLKLEARPAGTGVSQLRLQYETPLWILLVTTGLVLLIACANIANLMLARANARQREISIRLAIGASRMRLVRQLLAESILLALVGAALGLLVARAISRFLILFLSSQSVRLTLPIETDWRVIAYTAGLVVLTCLIFGLTPALRGTRIGAGAAMKASGRGLTADRHRFGFRRALVITQVAVSLVLLVGALLFSRSLRNLMNLESGYRPEGVLFVGVDAQRLKFEPEKRLVTFDQLLEQLKRTPHVEMVSTISHTPMVNGWNNNVRSRTEAANAPYVLSNMDRVGEGYFKTVGTALISGRDFDRRDTASSAKVAVVDRMFVEKVLNGRDPLAARFEIEAEAGQQPEVFDIVGVVENVKYSGLRSEFMPTAYFAESQKPASDESKVFVVRSSAPLTTLIPAVTDTVRNIHPSMGIQFQPFTTIIRDSLLSERLMATLSTFFGLLAAVLATIGLYGTLSYSVSQRRNEIGIRIALGADRGKLERMILSEALVLLIVGLGAGIGVALMATRTAQTLLYGLQPNDPLTMATAIGILALVTLLASYVPARRAARMEPTTVLREE